MSDKVTLADCPIGLFVANSGELCLKTEYGDNSGRIDAYIVSSGEMFWGSPPQSIESQRAEMVTPVEHVTLLKRPVAFRVPTGDSWVPDRDPTVPCPDCGDTYLYTNSYDRCYKCSRNIG